MPHLFYPNRVKATSASKLARIAYYATFHGEPGSAGDSGGEIDYQIDLPRGNQTARRQCEVDAGADNRERHGWQVPVWIASLSAPKRR